MAGTSSENHSCTAVALTGNTHSKLFFLSQNGTAPLQRNRRVLLYLLRIEPHAVWACLEHDVVDERMYAVVILVEQASKTRCFHVSV